MVRVFVGIEIPEDIKRYVITIQNRLKSLPIKAKFVEPENLHVSLSFLGEVGSTKLEDLKFRLDEITKSYGKFDFVLGSLMLIPNEKFTRVIALDIRSDALEALREVIVKTVNGKSHLPHLTLARIKTIMKNGEFLEKIKAITLNEMYVEVDSIYLVESILRKSGPVYTPLHRSYLK